MNNRFTTLILLTSMFLSCKSQQQVMQSDKYDWFPFSWYAADISGRHFDKLAILVPATVNDVKANFNLQFDLGSDATSLYGNVLSSYYSGDEINSFLLKDKKSVSDAGHTSYDTEGLQLKMGNFVYKNPDFKEDYGTAIVKDSLYTASVKHIGTLGANAFKDKILLIDYPNQRMCVLDKLDDYLNKYTAFVKAQSHNGRLHIPLTIKDKTYWFLFDTGASLFSINTNKDLWTQLVGNPVPKDTIVGNSWGEKVKFYGSPMKEPVYLGKFKLKNNYAWYNESQRLQEFNKSSGVDGLTGNIYFTEDIIVLDFKTNAFGILEK